jgi:hypothetical protein
MMRGGGGGAEGGMGEGDKVFCVMQFFASIDHSGRGHPMAAMKPHSRFNAYNNQQTYYATG